MRRGMASATSAGASGGGTNGHDVVAARQAVRGLGGRAVDGHQAVGDELVGVRARQPLAQAAGQEGVQALAGVVGEQLDGLRSRLCPRAESAAADRAPAGRPARPLPPRWRNRPR